MNRASAYDVFAPSVLAQVAASAAAAGANAGNAAGGNVSRRSSFRVPSTATATETTTVGYKENSPSPEKNDATLFVEEDRRMRRRGSQL